MKDSQQAIDKVLAGLRDVSAPGGMEQRVLAAMEERAAAQVGWGWRRWSIGLAAVALVLVAIVVLARPHEGRHDVVAVVKPALPMAGVVSEKQKRDTGVQTVTAIPKSPLPVTDTSAIRSAQNDVKYRRASAAAPVQVAAENPVATGGIPAPPMPLTEQEKLLLRLAHRNDATELTPLIADARAKQHEAFDAEFQEFFAPVAAAIDTNSNEKDKGDTR